MSLVISRSASVKNRILSVINPLRTFALLAVVVGLAACQEEKQLEVETRPVKTVVAEFSKPERILIYSGIVRPRIESDLGFRVSGKLIERLVDTGDRVQPGQVLARIDPIDLQLSEAAQLANVDAAKTRLAVAKAALSRSQRLIGNGYVSQAAYDTAKLEVDSAQGALDVAQAQLRQNRNQVGYAELKAGAAGVVTGVSAEPGQVVTSGQTIVTMAESEDVEIAVAVPENELSNVSLGMPAQVTLWSDNSVTADGKIREISGAAEAATRTYAVRISVPDAPQAMRLGMTANVQFRVKASPELQIPLAAITRNDKSVFVWVVDQQALTVAAREIALGDLGDEGVRVKSGLTEGELVVAAGVQFLQPGQKVRLTAKAAEIAHSN